MWCFWLAFWLPSAAAADRVSVRVDPVKGNNSDCHMTFTCQTIFHAVQVIGASQVELVSGIFNEVTVNIINVPSLVINGVPSATFFDCSYRPGETSGAAFNVLNSSVIFAGITFQNCSNLNNNGGAVSALGSNVTVMRCHFINCSAANGGALSSSGADRGLFLNVQNSTFTQNTAIGGLIGCPQDFRSPCSTWGGSLAAYDIFNVNITDSRMTNSCAAAIVPISSPQHIQSRNAVAGGGCVSVLFFGNSSGAALHFSGNFFFQCTVDVSNKSTGVAIGNGRFYHCSIMRSFFFHAATLL
jgi:hypothetical protein